MTVKCEQKCFFGNVTHIPPAVTHTLTHIECQEVILTGWCREFIEASSRPFMSAVTMHLNKHTAPSNTQTHRPLKDLEDTFQKMSRKEGRTEGGKHGGRSE